MKKKYYLIIFLFIALSSFSISDVFSKKTYVYKITKGSSQEKSSWLVKKKNDDYLITQTSENEIANSLYSLKYALKQLHVQSAKEDSDYTLEVKNKKLIVQGKAYGRKIKREYNLYGNWVQDFTFGLRPFMDSNRYKFLFTIVNPKDFTTNELIASKEGIEKLKINSTTYNAQKVKITLPGFKSMFWKAEVWYDLETYDLLKYRANEGPGTVMSTTILSSKR